jgi:hypothetical protein
VTDFASAAIPTMLCATEKIAKGRSCQRLGERTKAIIVGVRDGKTVTLYFFTWAAR